MNDTFSFEGKATKLNRASPKSVMEKNTPRMATFVRDSG
jgi:hypothetical protein